jgi:hypothetical protein
MTSQRTRQALVLMLRLLTFVGASAGTAAGAMPTAAPTPFLFLDPEANHDVTLEVMKALNAIFEREGLAIAFQPVQGPEAVNKKVGASYAIIASRFDRLWKALDLQPVLVSEANGNTTFQKLLVAQSNLKTDLSGMVVAAAVLPQHTADVQAVLTKHGYAAQSAYILAVAKDIDAMFAVTFGEAQAALVTTDSLNVLKQINPSAASRLQVLMKTDPELRAPLCIAKSLAATAMDDKLVQLFLKLDATPDGQALLRLMSISRWVPYSVGGGKWPARG